MKRIIAFTLVALLLLTTACQPTPESPIVVGKNADQMIEDASKPKPEWEDTKTIKERVNAPDEFCYNSTKSNLTVLANAPVYVPEGCEMPIVRVEPGEFPQEQIDRFWDVLVGEREMWRESDIRTKDEIQATILFLKKQMQDVAYEDTEQADDVKRIAELEKELQTAPNEKPAPVRVDSTLQKEQQMDDTTGKIMTETMSVYGSGGENGPRFSAQNIGIVMPAYTNQFGKGMAMIEYAADANRYAFGDNTPRDRYEVNASSQLDEKIADFITTTPAEAITIVEELIEKLDIPMCVRNIVLNVYYSDAEKHTPVHYFYSIQCVRVIDGLPMPFILGSTYVMRSEGESQYSEAWSYETLTIGIYDNRISDFDWRAPLQILDTKLESSALLPFSDIQAIFENMAPIAYVFQAENTKLTLEITEVRLEMMRVVEQNSIEHGLVVPVWNFYGVRHKERENGDKDSTSIYILLCINGIDGSIIDIDRGY